MGRQTGTKTEAQRQRNGGGTQRLVNMDVGESNFFTDRHRERDGETDTERDGETERDRENQRHRNEGRVPQTDLEVGAKALAVVRPPVLPGVAGLLAPRRDGSSEVGVTRRYVLTHQQPRIACASKQAHNGAQRCCLLRCRRKAAIHNTVLSADYTKFRTLQLNWFSQHADVTVCNRFCKLFLGYLSLLVAPHCMLCMVGFITPARVE